MSEERKLLQKIKSDVSTLINRYNDVMRENRQLKQEIDEKDVRLKQVRAEMVNLEKSNSNTNSNFEMNANVDELIKEIDNCITLLRQG